MKEQLRQLFEEKRIPIHRAALLQVAPPPLADDFDFDRIEGMMLGLAIGDSLGRSTEGRIPKSRRDKHGEIRDYVAGRRAPKGVGLPSDDTQLAFWTLEQLNDDGAFRPGRLAKKFVQSGTIYGMGQSVSAFRRNVKKGLPWHRCGVESAGNGALMRIAPIVIPHLKNPSAALWQDAALSAMLTHNDSGSIAACVAFVDLLWRALSGAPGASRWWLDRYLEVARALETKTDYTPRGGAPREFKGPLWSFVEETVPRTLEQGEPTLSACERWHSGAYLLETVPCALLILCRYGHDPEEAIVRAVNDTKDNDTIAAIVGAAVGALHGRGGLPRRWIDGLSGRTRESDDGRVFEILKEARKIWWFDRASNSAMETE